jgi:hypothetical protein
MANKIVIQVEGGLIQNIFATNPDIEVIIQDFDVEGSTDYFTWDDGTENGTEFLAWETSVSIDETIFDDVKSYIDKAE